MKTVILAAGLGTRIQHLYPGIPKVMIPINGKPLLLRTIEHMKAQGFDDFIINLHYLPDVITDYFGDGSKFGVKIQYSREEELLESAGAIKKIEPMIDSDDFILIYGDILNTADIYPLIDMHRKHGGIGVVLVKRSKNPLKGDIFEIDLASGEVLHVHARPHEIGTPASNMFTNAALYVWSRRVLEYIPSGKKVHLDKETIPLIHQKGEKLFAYPIDEQRDIVIDIGKEENLQRINELVAQGKII
jgi:mannose-1-phosphate guanylyltransferase